MLELVVLGTVGLFLLLLVGGLFKLLGFVGAMLLLPLKIIAGLCIGVVTLGAVTFCAPFMAAAPLLVLPLMLLPVLLLGGLLAAGLLVALRALFA